MRARSWNIAGERSYAAPVPPKRPITRRGAEKLGEREREVGLDPEDEAARWLAEHDPKPPPAVPKSVTKSVTLHRWRERQRREGSS
jgi:hypothetical protein